jgi:asparagine synthase (glutamine-hydrolysing)
MAQAPWQETLAALPSPEPMTDENAAIEAVRDAVAASLGDVDTDGLASAFSGGIDSAILAAHLDAPLYVAGFPESHDVEAARSAADALDRSLPVVEVSHDAIVEAVPRVVSATGRANAMDVAIALPLLLTAERVAADGFDRQQRLELGHPTAVRFVVIDADEAVLGEHLGVLPWNRSIPVERAFGEL